MPFLDLAEQAAGVIGVSPGDIISGAYQGIRDFLGLNDCADWRKARYRTLVDLAIREGDRTTIKDWLTRGRVDGATGTCNEYAIRYLAVALSEAAQAERMAPPSRSSRADPTTASAAYVGDRGDVKSVALGGTRRPFQQAPAGGGLLVPLLAVGAAVALRPRRRKKRGTR